MSKKKKRCLLVITGAFEADGGIAAVNRLVIKSFAEEGYFLDIHSLNERSSQVDNRYIPSGQVNLRVFNKNKVAFTVATWKAMLSCKYDYIVGDLVNLACIMAVFSKLFKKRYISWLYGIDVFPPRPDLEGRVGLRNAWKRLAISNYTRDVVTERFPNLSIEVCDLALDPVRHVASLPPEPPTFTGRIDLEAVDGVVRTLESQLILHVGRMDDAERYKGQDTLLQAFLEILEKFPRAQLLLAGQGKDSGRLRQIAESHPPAVQARIFMPGYVETSLLDQIYRTCYLFAMPSKMEGFGLVYLEAMSRAKPCLGGNVDATPGVVREGLTGLLVDDPTSAGQVAEKVIWLLDHPEEARAMGLAGYNLVRSQYLFPQFKRRFWQHISQEKPVL
jgi:glycosyltransferase involved in cell wall biosynthesis